MATYIISPTGNDANPGTVASPKAITFLNSLTAGDTAQLRGGTYVAQMALSNLRGTNAQRITIEPYQNESPVLDGQWNTAVHPLTTPGTLDLYEYDSLFKIQDSRYVTVKGIRCINSDGRAFSVTRCHNLIFDGISGEDIYGMSFNCIGSGTGTPTTSNITLKNADFYNVCVAWKWFQQTVEGVYINTIPTSVFFGRGVENCTVSRCTIERAGAEGFAAARGSRYITMSDCVAVDCRHLLFYLAHTQYSVLERCVGYFTAAGVAAIPSMRGDGIIIRDEDGGENQGYGVDYSSKNNTVRNCIVIDAKYGYQGFGTQATMVNFHLNNNTFVNCLQNILNRGVSGTRPTPVGNVFENNIFYNGLAYTSNLFYSPSESTGNQINTSSGSTYRNNCWYDVNGSARPANGVGTGDVLDNPDLLDPEYALNGVKATQFRDLNLGLKYGPTSVSPCIDAASSTATTGDFFNRAAEGGRDIGAVEYTTGGIPSDPGGNNGGGGGGGSGGGNGGGGGGDALPTVYITPKTWAPGDAPDATEANKYKQALDSIHGIAGDVEIWHPSAALKTGEDNNHFMRHVHRWLWYSGSGTLEDADAQNETITLSANSNGSPARYDLNTVSWLAPGKLYYVSDCTWAIETPDP